VISSEGCVCPDRKAELEGRDHGEEFYYNKNFGACFACDAALTK